ncbi:MAG: hypothetical protein ACRD3I_13705, partial [Terriglobales bacterium]
MESKMMTETTKAGALRWFSGKGREKAAIALDLIATSEAQGFWVPKASRSTRAVLGKANIAANLARKHGKELDAVGG